MNKGGRPRKANKMSKQESSRQLRERKKKLGIRREDGIGEDGRMLKLPAFFKRMKKHQIESERKRLLGLKRRQDTPDRLKGMPSLVLIRAHQDRLRDSSLSVEESVMRQKKLFDQEHRIFVDHPRSASESPSTSTGSVDPNAVDPKDAELLLGLSQEVRRYPRRDRIQVRRN